MTGSVPDIDAWTIFGYGEPVFYNFTRASQTTRDFPPDEQKMLGRWLGGCRNDATVRTYFVLTINGSIIPRSDVIPMTEEERNNPKFIHMLQHFDDTINKNNADDLLPKDEVDMFTYFQGRKEVISKQPPGDLDPARDNCYGTVTKDISLPFDEFIGQLVRVPFQEGTAVVKILNKHKKFDTNLKGGDGSSTDVYTARLPDGSEREYTKNMVAENLYAQCDNDGNVMRLVDEIVDHRSDNTATKVSDGKYFDQRTQAWRNRKNLKGWELSSVPWRTTWCRGRPSGHSGLAVSLRWISSPASVRSVSGMCSTGSLQALKINHSSKPRQSTSK